MPIAVRATGIGSWPSLNPEYYILNARTDASITTSGDFISRTSNSNYDFVTGWLILDDQADLADTNTISFNRGGNGVSLIDNIHVFGSNSNDDYTITGLEMVQAPSAFNASVTYSTLYFGTADFTTFSSPVPLPSTLFGGRTLREDPDYSETYFVTSGALPVFFSFYDPTTMAQANLPWSTEEFLQASAQLRVGNAAPLYALFGRAPLDASLTDGADDFHGYGNNDVIDGRGGADTLFGWGGNDTIYGGGGADSLHGDGGNDSLIGGAGNDGLFGEDGNDTIAGEAGDDAVIGGSGDDLLTGAEGNDAVYGGTGNDTLTGGDGTNALYGETGDDLYLFSGTTGVTSIYDASGFDTIRFDQQMVLDWENNIFLGQTLRVIFTQNVLDRFELSAAADDLRLGTATTVSSQVDAGAGNDTVAGGASGDLIFGASGNDVLYGRSEGDVLDGGADLDRLFGEQGNDLLRGGTGDDTLDGGTETDTAYFDDHFGALQRGWTINMITNLATSIIANAPLGSPNLFIFETDRLIGIENAFGSNGDDEFYTRGNNNHFDGVSGYDRLYLAAQVQNALALSGFVNADDTVDLQSGTSSRVARYTLNGGVTTEVMTFTNIDEVRTNVGNDVVNGSAGHDKAYGEAGNDRLEGRGGDDTLFGGDGTDTLIGGTDDDMLSGGGGNDSLDGGLQSAFGDTADYSEATASVTVWLDAAIHMASGTDVGTDTILNIENVTTGAGNDLVYSDVNGNRLRLGFGHDVVIDAGGSDTIYAGDGNDTIFAASGHDVVVAEAGDDIVAGGLGSDWINAGAGLDFVLAEDGDDQVYGGDDRDLLYGQAGNDILAGDGGDDFLSGDVGNNSFYGGDGLDVIFGDAGVDIGFGDADRDWLYGFAGNDTLNGGAGDDVIGGGDGFDTLYGDNGADAIFGEANNDTISAGSGGDYVVGGAGVNTISLGGGQDIIVSTANENGVQRVADFGIADFDQIWLVGWGFADTAAALASCQQAGTDVVLEHGTDQVILQNISLSQLNTYNFVLF